MANPLGHGQEFGGIRTFLHAPYINDIEKIDADVVVVGVPFDEGTSARPGAFTSPLISTFLIRRLPPAREL